MPVLAVFHSSINQEQYEKLRKDVRWEEDRPKGALFHAAATDENGQVHVADVWESNEDLNNFVQNRLMPVFMKAGLNPPDVTLYSTCNVNIYPAADKFRLK